MILYFEKKQSFFGVNSHDTFLTNYDSPQQGGSHIHLGQKSLTSRQKETKHSMPSLLELPEYVNLECTLAVGWKRLDERSQSSRNE